jgi:hypothetical protein
MPLEKKKERKLTKEKNTKQSKAKQRKSPISIKERKKGSKSCTKS